MEEGRAPPATKRARRTPQKVAQPNSGGAAMDDRLSALDDATLHRIISLLPFREAAATSVLSRRWPRVFATLPNLTVQPATFNRRDFPDDGDEDYCEDPHRWMDALASVLESRAAPISSFDVSFRYMGQYDDWFHGLFRHLCGSGSPLELKIANTKFRELYPVPSPIYSCATLTSLELSHWRLKVPAKLAGLRALRSLSLTSVVATDAELRRFISRCTALERLEMYRVHRARNVVLRAPRLETLEIYSHRPLRVSVKNAARLEEVKLTLDYLYPEGSWSIQDNMDSDVDYSYSEIDDMCNYQKMAKREHKNTDEVGNMLTFLGGLGSTKKLHLDLPTARSMTRGAANASKLPKKLGKKSLLLGLETLTLDLDLNHEVLATLVSCLLNSSPNLKDLRITFDCDSSHEDESWDWEDSSHENESWEELPALAAEFWEEQLKNADCVLNHLSSFTLFLESPFEGRGNGNPCEGICRAMLMKARVLKRMRVEVSRYDVTKPEHEARIEAWRNELNHWPRASPDVLVELSLVRSASF